MNNVEISLAMGQHERGRPLADGRVQPEGITLNAVMLNDDGGRHSRFYKGEFDASELSFGGYIARWEGGADFAAIPVFLNRRFRHSFIYINSDAGIHHPKDLEGKRVGIRSWTTTASVWARGLLQHDYQVDLNKILWLMERPIKEGWSPPSGIRISPLPRPAELIELLAQGEIDALIVPAVINHPKVRRLFPDFQEIELDYYRRTGVFPISHVMAIRKMVLDKNPWVASSLFKAFHEAKRLAYEYADDPGHSNLVWYGEYMEKEREIFGPDPFPFGIEENQKALEEFVTYAFEQGLTHKRHPIEDLFFPGYR